MPQSDYWPFTNNKDVEDGINIGESSLLKRQVGLMEGEVKEIQMELAAIKRDRLFLSIHKPAESEPMSLDTDDSVIKKTSKGHDELDTVRVPQIAQLREELLRAKNAADEERFQKEKFEWKLKDLEMKINSIFSKGVTEDSRKFSSEEVASLKKRLRDTRDEMAELNLVVHERNEEVQEYRARYFQAQQEVEELKRQFDAIEADNKEMSDEIQTEIQNLKMQFRDQLEELSPLPDMLKGAQLQLQQAKQLQNLAENKSNQLSNELNCVKEKLVEAVNNYNGEKAQRIEAVEENNALKHELQSKETEIYDLYCSLDDYKNQLIRMEEKFSQLDQRYTEKVQICAHLTDDLNELREKSNRALARNKERAESTRHFLQTQITELERQLIHSRAQSRSFQKERDEIRTRMQFQLNSLQENYGVVEVRLRTIQNQVAALKNSYAVILANEGENVDIVTIQAI